MKTKNLILLFLLLASLPLFSQKYELARNGAGMRGKQMEHLQYTTCYNQMWMQAYWVAWELTKKETEGSIARPLLRCTADPCLHGWYPTHGDYYKSGYERGHLCPFNDCNYMWRAVEESFYFTNICPQTHALNGGPWYTLEKKCQDLAKEYGSVYICCGPIMEKPIKRFSKDSIAIPKKFFKVLLLKKNDTWQSIGFIMPNSTELSDSIETYAMTVDEVEKLTGLDFFYKLPDEIENKVESLYNIKEW